MNSPQHLLLLLTAFFHTVLQASWQGSLAIVLVVIVRRVFGARVPARWHYLLWFLVLARLLVPTSMLPHSRASLGNIHAVAGPFGRQPSPAADEAAPAHVIIVPPPDRDGLPHEAKPAEFTAPSPIAARRSWPWWELAALAWLAGAFVLGGWLAACSLRLSRKVRRETLPADPTLLAVWASCCQRWLRRAAPRVLMGDWVHSPALLGLWRPVLLLPRQVPAAFSTEDWEHVFAHEIAHLRWRDHWSQLLLHLAWCAHWFNPVVWLGLRRLRADRELAADEWALRHLTGERSLAYGETLFKTVADRPVASSFQPGLVGISEDGAQIKQRLQRITAFLPRPHLYGSLAGLGALLLLGTVVLGQGPADVASPVASPSPTTNETPKAAQKPASSATVTPSPQYRAATAQKLSGEMLEAIRADDATKVTSLLLDAGADPNQADKSGNTPIVYAQSAAVAQVLIDHGAKLTGLPEPLLPRMITFGFAPAAALAAVLKAGADQDAVTLNEALQRTDMYKEDLPDQKNIRELLLAHGAKPNPSVQNFRPGRDYHIGVSAADGTLPGNDSTRVHVWESNGHGWGVMDFEAQADTTVRVSINHDTTSATLAATSDGFATAYAGPFTPPTEEKLGSLHFTLERGFRAAIETVDGAGQPISGAQLTAYYPGPPKLDLGTAATNASGQAVFEHVGVAPLTVRVNAAGYQTDTVDAIVFDPAKPYRWALTKAPLLPGSVTASATGQAVAGAMIKLASVRGPHKETYSDPEAAPVLATSGADGHFALTSLRPDSVYDLFVDAPGIGGVQLRGVKTTQTELKVTLGPELFVRGKVIHVPAGLIHDYQMALRYHQTFKIGDGYGGVGKLRMLKPQNGEADFSVGPFYKVVDESPDPAGGAGWPRNLKATKAVSLYVDSEQRKDFDIDQLPISNLIFDLGGKSAPANGPTQSTAKGDSKTDAAATTLSPAPTPGGLQEQPSSPAAPVIKQGIETTGHVSMADGTPLGKSQIMARVYSVQGVGDTMVGSERVEDGSFPLRTFDDTTSATVAVEQPGCAVVFAGPFKGPDLDKLNGLKLQLTRGLAASVQTVDEAGRPIAGARLQSYYPGPPEIACAELTTDVSGSALIEHIGQAPMNIRVLADGFQANELGGLHLDPAKPYRWTLKAAQPLHGVVVAAVTGKPIPGAIIKLGGSRGPQFANQFMPEAAVPLATADAQGRFALSVLRPDSRYFLFVEAPGYSGAYLKEVRLAKGDLKVELGPELMIRGKIIHAPASVIHLGKLYLRYGQTFDFGDHHSVSGGDDLTLVPVDGEADFSIGPFYSVFDQSPDPADVPVNKQKLIQIYVDTLADASFRIDQLPISNFVFDLAEKTSPASAPAKPIAGSEPDNRHVVLAAGRSLDPAASSAPAQPAGTTAPAGAQNAAKPLEPARGIHVEGVVSTADGAPIGVNETHITVALIFGPSGTHF